MSSIEKEPSSAAAAVQARNTTWTDEKDVGNSQACAVDAGTGAVVLEHNPQHAAEYAEYLRLDEYYNNNPKAKKRLIRLLDIRIIPMLFLYYLLNSLDKSNAGNVKIYTFLKDTNMTGTQFNLALTWYFFTYAGLEAPSKYVMDPHFPEYLTDCII